MTDSLKMREMLLAERDIVAGDECPDCQGQGKKYYANTSTWRYGIGGAAITMDVCDKCWGSGSRTRIWPSHQEFYEMKKRLENS
jgi:hypothetical protein